MKDPEAHRLAAALAQETGETMTRVVTEALRERFQRLPGRPGEAGTEELRTIARRAAAHLKRPYLDRPPWQLSSLESPNWNCISG
ncbi:MAG: type II toxin-antitoxin system VapB family antitoxin [Bryobacteraceae bacterium]